MKTMKAGAGQKGRFVNNNVFHIRLNPNITEKIDLKNPLFLKVLEQQYAAKYLQSMGVETTPKNISRILKERPLNTCEIVESRMTGGLHTDTITIITKGEQNLAEENSANQEVTYQMLKILDLKKMALKKETKSIQRRTYINNKKEKKEQEEAKQNLKHLDFNIKSIKARYIFPFNETFNRKNNFKMKDLSEFDTEIDHQIFVFSQKIFRFPFTQIKLNLNTLKQLQTPISAKFSDVVSFLQSFYQQFPQNIFPINPQTKDGQKNRKSKLRGLNKQIHIIFQKKNVDKMFALLRGENNAKFIGVFLHLAYWSVFGSVNPIQIENSTKKKMYLMIKQTMEYFQLQTQNRKIWIDLVQPMIILTLKMAMDYFFHDQYPKLFQSEESKKVNADEIAFDKILLFVDQILDQNNINGRFIFLESDIDGPKGNFTKDNKFIRKRIFGTSPALQMILPEPKDGKTRSIIAKNMQSEPRDSKSLAHISRILPQSESQKALIKQQEEEDRYSRQKLLSLALMKIRNRIQEISGSHPLNPIISLDDK